MATLHDMKKYLNYEFSSGGYTGDDYKSFELKYINYLKSIARNYGWELVNIGKNHYCFTVFIKKVNKFAYISISDVRFWKNEWFNHILYRAAHHQKDYRGGGNCYASLPLLSFAIKQLFERGCYCENAFSQSWL